MQNYKIVLSYDGTDFYGWQRQPKTRTIQGVLEDTLAKISQKKVAVVGAGRTDAGVHALGQVANFRAAIRLKEDALKKAINADLPDDVRVIELKKASADFDARRDAKAKVYQYRIFCHPEINPFVFRYALHRPHPLNVARMRKAARLFRREGDFSGFSSNRLLYPVRKVTRSEIKKSGDEIIYTIEANGFLRYMVRTIVGTILEVGRGRVALEDIESIFGEKKRTLSSPTAPAKGLCLIKVIY